MRGTAQRRRGEQGSTSGTTSTHAAHRASTRTPQVAIVLRREAQGCGSEARLRGSRHGSEAQGKAPRLKARLRGSRARLRGARARLRGTRARLRGARARLRGARARLRGHGSEAQGHGSEAQGAAPRLKGAAPRRKARLRSSRPPDLRREAQGHDFDAEARGSRPPAPRREAQRRDFEADLELRGARNTSRGARARRDFDSAAEGARVRGVGRD